MIHIDKGKKPGYLESEIIDLATEKLEEFYKAKDRGQKRYEFPFNSDVDGSLKPILYGLFHGKCGYCEQKIENPFAGIIDRFRPHNGVRDKKEYYQDLYWWLVFDWDNLIYSCRECNQHKANYFPIKGKRAINSGMSLEAEGKMLLNPCTDPVEQHFRFRKGILDSDTYEGDQTIELLKLNRTSLVNMRNSGIREISRIIEVMIKSSEETRPTDLKYLNQIFDKDPSIEFLFAKYEYLLEELDQNPFIRKYLINDNDEYEDLTDTNIKLKRVKRSNTKITKSDFFPIEYIDIKHFKGVDNIRIDFPTDQPKQNSWLVLLGENGVGKSSILQAIALGLKSTFTTKDAEGIPSFIKTGKPKAYIVVKERDSENIIETTLTRSDKSISQSGKFNSFLMGYGSLRLSTEEIENKKGKDTHRVSYKNLFKPTEALNDVTEWLQSIHSENRPHFDSIAFSIKQLLPHDFVDNELTIHDGEIMFKNSKKKFSELSDGFKSTITLALDIMMKLSSENTDMEKMTGVVLIDELGNQLHPRWQMRVTNQLRKVFPKINFIVSTHHPLCLRGAKPNEVVLLKNIEGKVQVITNLPDPSELRVDQLLASEFFGLNSLIDPELEADFNRYYELLALQFDTSAKEREELDSLKQTLRNKKHLGSSLREELMYSVIDNLLAQKIIFSKQLTSRDALKKEAVERVKKIWRDLNIEINDQS